jgi:hypothetical protein
MLRACEVEALKFSIIAPSDCCADVVYSTVGQRRDAILPWAASCGKNCSGLLILHWVARELRRCDVKMNFASIATIGSLTCVVVCWTIFMIAKI